MLQGEKKFLFFFYFFRFYLNCVIMAFFFFHLLLLGRSFRSKRLGAIRVALKKKLKKGVLRFRKKPQQRPLWGSIRWLPGDQKLSQGFKATRTATGPQENGVWLILTFFRAFTGCDMAKTTSRLSRIGVLQHSMLRFFNFWRQLKLFGSF
jgi:hypothetical protein